MALHKINDELHTVDPMLQRIGHGTVAGEHVSAGSIDTGASASLIFADDPDITYYNPFGVPDEIQRDVDLGVAGTPPTSFHIATAGDQIAWSYTPTTNVRLYEFVVALYYDAKINAGTTLKCTINSDSSGTPGTVIATAYDELTRAQTLPLSSITNGNSKQGYGWTGFHFFLNKADSTGQYYASGTTQDPVTLTAGTKYWFIVTTAFPAAGTNLGGNVYLVGKNDQTINPNRLTVKPNGGSWTTDSTTIPFFPKYGIITSGWKISHSINGSFGGVSRQLANYDFTKLVGVPTLGNTYMPRWGQGQNGVDPVDSDTIGVALTGPNDQNAATAVYVDQACAHGPYFTLQARTTYVGFVQDMIENMLYDSGGLDDATRTLTLTSGSLTDPTIPTVTPTGTAGATSYSYYVVAKDSLGYRTNVSPVRTITNGNATLSGTNYNAISWAAVTGAVAYDVLVNNTSTLLTTTTATSFNDTGTPAEGSRTMSYTPPVFNETTTMSWVYRKELVLYIDGVPTTVLYGGNTGSASSVVTQSVSVLRQLTDYVSGLDDKLHSIKVGLRYYKYMWSGIGVGAGSSSPFSEANAVPDQVRFEGLELKPRISFDALGIYSYSVLATVTTDGNGNARLTVPAPVGYTLVQYVGAYNPVNSPATTTAIRCSIGANCVIINGGAATTAYSIRVTMLISPSRSI